MNSNRPSLLNDEKKIKLILAKALLACAVLLLLGHQTALGEYLIRALTPVYETVIEAVHPEFQADISIEADRDEPSIVLDVTALRDIPYTPSKSLPAGTSVKGTEATILHSLVPVVILLTTMLVWPVQRFAQRILMIALAVPALLLVTSVTTPLQMLGLLETAFNNAALKHGFARETPTVLSWMFFTEGGARWLIPILVGVSCGALVNKLTDSPVAQNRD